MFSYADGFFMSCKKDALANIGGLIVLRDQEIYQRSLEFIIRFEGFFTYGGLAGRDLAAIAAGLLEGIEPDYLASRIEQVEYLGSELHQAKIPVIRPYGGHAIFIDARKFFPHVPDHEYPAQVLGVELYLISGVRGIGTGRLLIDRNLETGQEQDSKTELLRLALPRRVFTRNHMSYIASALCHLYGQRDKIKNGFRIKSEPAKLRYFGVELDRIRGE
jgi:tryptophanase